MHGEELAIGSMGQGHEAPSPLAFPLSIVSPLSFSSLHPVTSPLDHPSLFCALQCLFHLTSLLPHLSPPSHVCPFSSLSPPLPHLFTFLDIFLPSPLPFLTFPPSLLPSISSLFPPKLTSLLPHRDSLFPPPLLAPPSPQISIVHLSPIPLPVTRSAHLPPNATRATLPPCHQNDSKERRYSIT